MRALLILFLVSILINNSYPQLSSTEPLEINRNMLVNSAGLPNEFLLFSSDSATQILFNPARTYNFSTNFVYVNYLSDYSYSYILPVNTIRLFGTIEIEPLSPGLIKSSANSYPTLYEEEYNSSKNPTFSAAALFGSGNAKWLLTVSNGINLVKNKYNYISNEESIYDPISSYNTDKYQSTQIYNSDEMLTTLKIARIWNSGTKSFSLGAFGIIYTNDINSYQDLSRIKYNYYNSTTDSTRRRNLDYILSTEERKINNSRFAVGLELGVCDKDWDYICSFSYQNEDNSGNSILRGSEIAYDSSYYSYPWGVYRNENYINDNKDIDHSPYLLNLNNYFQHSVDWITKNDNFFITLKSFYSPGEFSYKNDYSRIYLSYYNEILENGDTTSINQTGNDNSESWGVFLSSGYALSASFSDLFILTGIKLTGSINHLEYLNSNLSYQSSSSITENVLKNNFAGLTIPLYLNYSPAEWVSLYGGINYSYIYNKIKYIIKTNEVDYYSYPSETNENSTSETTISEWNSSKSIYAGCELRHSSGLKVQLYFDENVTTIKDWNVSVGYHF